MPFSVDIGNFFVNVIVLLAGEIKRKYTSCSFSAQSGVSFLAYVWHPVPGITHTSAAFSGVSRVTAVIIYFYFEGSEEKTLSKYSAHMHRHRT